MMKLIKRILSLLVFVVPKPLKPIVTHARFFTGSLCAKVFSVQRYPNSSPGVLGLFRQWNPLAVVGLVIAIAILPLDAVSIRHGSHIFDEVIEGFSPSVTDGYSSSSVILPILGIRLIASVLHRIPNLVRWNEMGVIGFSVPIERPSEPRTSTAFGSSESQVSESKMSNHSAIADPRNLLNFRIDYPGNGYRSKSFADGISRFSVFHGGVIPHVSQDYKK